MAKINPYSNPLYVLEELMQALKSDDPEISGALDRITALTGIQKQVLLDMASDAHDSISQISNITDAVVHLNNDLTIRRWNPAAEKIYGFSADEAMGQNIEELLQTEYDIESRQQSLESFQEHGMWTGELVHRRKDGTRIQVYTRLAQTHNARGLLTGIVSLFRDISGNVSSANMPELMTTRLRTMLKATNEAIWDWDFRTNRHWWSEGMERVFGYGPDELEPGPESWYSRIHPEDKERITEAIHLAINGSASYWQDDYKFRKKDGSWAYVIDRGHIIRDEAGMAVRMIGGLSDRTEQRSMIYELADAHRRLSSHLNNSPLAVVEWDADFNMISWSTRAEEIFGWKSSEVIGKNLKIWKFIHDDDNERVKKEMNDLITGKVKSNVVANRNYCKDGNSVTCEWYNSVLFDSDGNRVSFFSQAHDISELAISQQNLRKSEEMYRTIVDTAHEGIWLIDEEGKTTYVNRRLSEILGYSAVDMKGHTFTGFTHEDYIGQASDGFEERKKGEMESNEILLKHRDGHGVWVHYNANPIHDNSGRFTGALAMVTDITGKKKTDEVITSSLREKQVMLEEIHHRVKNNMQLISSLMQLQAMKVSDASVKALFDDSHSRILSMALVHENLYEADDMSSVDFGDYLQKLTGNLRDVYAGAPVTISVESGDIKLGIGQAIPLGLIVNELDEFHTARVSRRAGGDDFGGTGGRIKRNTSTYGKG
ncbi:MAG: PAS domain S-box protein [Cyclonatronaceae bacterium]